MLETIKSKLILLIAVAVIGILATSGTGSKGIHSCSDALYEVSDVRLPSVLGLEIVNEGQTAVRAHNLETAIWENDYNAKSNFEKVLKDKKDVWDRIEKGWKLYEPLPQTKEEEILWKQFVQEWNAWKADDTKITEVIKRLSENNSVETQKQLFKEFYRLYDAQIKTFAASEATLLKIIDLNIRVAEDANKDGKVVVSFSKVSMIVVALLATILAVSISIIIIKNIGKSIKSAELGCEEMAKTKDLLKKIETGSKDEINEAMQSVNLLISQLSNALDNAKKAATENASVAAELSATSLQIGNRTEDTARSIAETSKSSKEISIILEDSANGLKKSEIQINNASLGVRDAAKNVLELSGSLQNIVDE